MKHTIKIIAFALILALSFGTALQAAGPVMELGGAPKKIEKVEAAKTVASKAKIEHIKPGTDFLMEMESWMRGDLDVQIFDQNGDLVQSSSAHIDGQDNTLKFKAGDLNKGIYKIKVLTRSRVQKKKIIID